MDQNTSDLPETKRHHFLFHIFKMDKADNPMPKKQAEKLLDCMKIVFTSKTMKGKGR